MKYVCFFTLVLAAAAYSVFADGTAENPYRVNMDTEYKVARSVDEGGGVMESPLHPLIMTFVNSDGSVSVCSPFDEAQETYIYEYTKDLRYIKTMKFKNAHKRFGAFIKDSEGNYYIFSGEGVSEGEFDRHNMALEKYDSNGNQTAFRSFPAREFNFELGVKQLFYSGSCRLEISGDRIAVYFASLRHRALDGINHQSSYGFLLYKNNLENIYFHMYGVSSHSFNQYILPIENGFVFADQADGGPAGRGFVFNKVAGNKHERMDFNALRFKNSEVYQYTFAQLGGLAKTRNGYIFAGTYEKTDYVAPLSAGVNILAHNDSRNVFILTFDDAMTKAGSPVWITDYDDKENDNAASPKIAALDGGRYLIMWERMNNSYWDQAEYRWGNRVDLPGGNNMTASGKKHMNRNMSRDEEWERLSDRDRMTRNLCFEGTYAVIVDERGKRLSSVMELPNVRLNNNDVLRYNKTTGCVYWAVNGGGRRITVFSFNPDKPIKIEASKHLFFEP